MTYRSFHHSCQGHTHITQNKPCQDASISWTTEQAAVIVVSDGHGNIRHLRSQIGSQIACETVSRALKAFLNHPQQPLQALKYRPSIAFENLKESILAAWYDDVHAHWMQNPFTQDELDQLRRQNLARYADDYENGKQIERAYGCTLVAFAITDAFWMALQLGDGEIAWTDGTGRFAFPLSEDDLAVGEITHSLCEIDAKQHFTHAWGTDQPAAAFVYTDGIQKAYPRQSLDLTNMLTWSGNTLQTSKDAPSSLPNYLARIAMEGTPQDDVSLAMLIKDSVQLPAAVYSPKQIEHEKANCETLLNECRAVLAFNKQTRETLIHMLESAGDNVTPQLEADFKMVEQILEREQHNENQLLQKIEQWNALLSSISPGEDAQTAPVAEEANTSASDDNSMDKPVPSAVNHPEISSEANDADSAEDDSEDTPEDESEEHASISSDACSEDSCAPSSLENTQDIPSALTDDSSKSIPQDKNLSLFENIQQQFLRLFHHS